MATQTDVLLYDLSIGTYIHNLKALSKFLKTGEDYATEKGIPHAQLLESRLIADMQPLVYQIQRVSDSAKSAAARLTGTEPVSMADDETTFAHLQERLAKTLAVLEKVDPQSLAGKEATLVDFKAGDNILQVSATNLVQRFATPNFFFHMTTTYALLRKEGVPLGKKDFLSRD